jgi:hypothetical protein
MIYRKSARLSAAFLGLLAEGLFFCCVCSTVALADGSESIARRLGYEGCRLSKPLKIAEVMGKSMSGGNDANRSHPDWDELIAKYAPGDLIYFVDCKRAEPTRIFAGTSLYVLVREGAVIARAVETMHD